MEELKKLLKANSISDLTVKLYLMEKGNVILSQTEYDNLGVIDEDGVIP